MVSINCLTYNHEKYIRKCLDGFLMQKTNFKFEVLIHDDASTDHTADIIREYEKKYPDIIKPIYQKENQYSKGVKISFTYQYPRAKGKYIAVCEGDDFWTDELKLQKQFDALENNQDCWMCVHKVQHVSENGDKRNLFRPDAQINAGMINSRHFVELIENWAFQTSSYFCRKIPELCDIEMLPKFFFATDVGDTPLMLLFATKGNVFYIDEIMSCYRQGAADSWHNSFKKLSSSKKISHYQKQIDMIEEFDSYSNNKFHDICEHLILCLQYVITKQKGNFLKIFKAEFKQFYNKEKATGLNPLHETIGYAFPWLIRIKRGLKLKKHGK